MNEETLFQDGDVLITTSRAKFGATTYPIGGITAVSTAAIPAKRNGGVLLAILGVLVLVLSSGSALAGEPFALNGGHAFGALVATLGVVLAVLAKGKYAVRLATAGGQVDALVSENADRIARATVALEHAVSRR